MHQQKPASPVTALTAHAGSPLQSDPELEGGRVWSCACRGLQILARDSSLSAG